MAKVSAFATLLALGLLGAPASAGPADLVARPQAVSVNAFAVGITTLPSDALFYRPRTLPTGPAPLLVLLHGAGQPPADLIERFRQVADDRGVMLLAPKSRGGSWDLVPKPGGKPRFGEDVPMIDGLLRDVFAKAPVDPKRVVLLGFSDGAGYALSLGTANPKLFRGIVALSPGYVVPPPGAGSAQRIFITHGTNDRWTPFDQAERVVVGLLRQAGADPHFRQHTGGHEIEPRSLEAGLNFTLGRPKR
jgi:phospholipase/carboxylesterase